MKGALMLFAYPSKGNKRKHFHAGCDLQPKVVNCSEEMWNQSTPKISMLKFSMAQAFRMVEWFSTTCVPIAAPEMEARSMSRPLLTLDVLQVYNEHGPSNWPGRVPAVVSVSSGFTSEGEKYVNDEDFVSVTHGYLMAALVLICTPLLMLYLLAGARLRWMNYTFFIPVLLTGWGFGGFLIPTFTIGPVDVGCGKETGQERALSST
ncbi:hypothetical protein BGZ57DRAFT_854323 [Hyaloscypha finlandica]|nr:hypothetical protein BGZ57DRAFT_854323 [Hyaloscypha finlandica]